MMSSWPGLLRRRTAALQLLAFIVLVGVVACSARSGGVPPVPTWPVPAEPLPEATSTLSSEFGPATWALDPAFASPDADATELHILVWEEACSSGSPATGRMSAPVIEYGSDSVTITIGVRSIEVPPGTGVTCPGPPGTPAILRLSEPLGVRSLLDGGPEPPAAPSPRF